MGASGVACGEGDRAVPSSARDIDGTSGAHADVHGALPEGADSVSRALPVVSCAGDFALNTVVSTAAASPGSRLLRVLGGGHSADRGGCSGAGIVACRSGLVSVALSEFLDLCHLTMLTVCVHEVFVVMVTRIHVGTHVARANSWSTLHAARGNSGGHVNSGGCIYNLCGGVRGGTKPRSTSTRGQVWCPAVEKLASLQQVSGSLQ